MKTIKVGRQIWLKKTNLEKTPKDKATKFFSWKQVQEVIIKNFILFVYICFFFILPPNDKTGHSDSDKH